MSHAWHLLVGNKPSVGDAAAAATCADGSRRAAEFGQQRSSRLGWDLLIGCVGLFVDGLGRLIDWFVEPRDLVRLQRAYAWNQTCAVGVYAWACSRARSLGVLGPAIWLRAPLQRLAL
jgi:hypothetical protein